MPKRIDINAIAAITGSRYPAPYDAPCAARLRYRLGDAANLTDFGVNLMRLAPGAWSSQRHWHTAEDEFVYVIEGEVVLVTDAGEEILSAGDAAGFKAGVRDGHSFAEPLETRGGRLEIGSRKPMEDEGEYPDIDMRFLKDDSYAHKDGTPVSRRLKKRRLGGFNATPTCVGTAHSRAGRATTLAQSCRRLSSPPAVELQSVVSLTSRVPANVSDRDCSSASKAVRPSRVKGCGGAVKSILWRASTSSFCTRIPATLEMRQVRMKIERIDAGQ